MGIFLISFDGFFFKLVFVIVILLYFFCMILLVLFYLFSMNIMREMKLYLFSKLDLNKRNCFKYICLFIN